MLTLGREIINGSFTVTASITPGRIYRGIDKISGKPCLICESDFVRESEKKLTDRLSFPVHEGLPSIIACEARNADNGEPALMVTSLPRGESLKSLSEKLNEQEACRLVSGLADTFKQIHSTGLYLGWCYPEQIYIYPSSSSFSGYLVQVPFFFGLEKKKKVLDNRPPLFESFPFLSPEMVEKKKTRQQSDTFILCSILYRLIEGEYAFSTNMIGSYMTYLCTAEYREPASEFLKNIMQRAFAPKWKERFTMDELQGLLENVMNNKEDTV